MSDSDDSSFTGRLSRTVRTSTAMAGLGARLAGKRFLGIEFDQEEHARALRQALGNLKGPLMKVAQFLATVPEAIPDEYVAELSQLQSNAPPMGWLFVKRRMASELGPDWKQRFASFEQTAAAAASLGQVHRATALDGRALACKLQYPDMASAVESDLNQLKIVLGIFERYDKAVSTGGIHAELAERLREELDYEREANNMRLYRAILADEPTIRIPEPVAELSTRRLLTMNWLDGEKVLDFVAAHPELRDTVARNLFRAWYVPFYRYGVIHGDPHLGNYQARGNGDVDLLDFGMIRVFPPRFVQAVIDLQRAIETNDDALAADAYRAWGFGEVKGELLATLNVWARFLYEPLLDDRVRKIGVAEGAVYGRETAMTVHKKLRELGGIKVPREFLLMDRAALGLGSVFIRLGAELNWHKLYHELIDGFDAAALEQRQRTLLAQHDVPH
ncbi:ABC1 kinase family protein [Roseiterribacter gracilis]|uniref:ABC transporter ATP-binding protein n=1 Tax=Roseiterribacter gracilis TaxID=2812848 RepID=A0A8S8X8Q2_9PROT|nr:ABC transporter ATP-binding protein [Rhodospirillales bacterium TMPK1]